MGQVHPESTLVKGENPGLSALALSSGCSTFFKLDELVELAAPWFL